MSENYETDDQEASVCSEDYVSGLPDPAPLEYYEEEERLHKPKRVGSFWKKPPTFVYKDNFGYGVNSYQPMIDYLDYKDSGGRAKQEPVHLPFSEERCMRKYHATKPYKQYENSDIDIYIDKGEKIRTQIRQNDAAGISNVLNRTHTNWSMTAKYVQLVKNSYVKNYNKKPPKEDDGEQVAIKKPKSFYENYKPKQSIATLKPRIVSNYLVMDVGDILSLVSHNKLEHEATMSQRRERQKQIDAEFEDTLSRTSANNKSYNSKAPQPYLNAVNFVDVMKVTDDLIDRNHWRRQQELAALNDKVCKMAAYDNSKTQLAYKLRELDDEVIAMNDDAVAMRKKHTTERINRSDIGELALSDLAIEPRPVLHGTSAYNVDSIQQLREKYKVPSTRDSSFDPVAEVEMQRPRRIKGESDNLSEVQTRVIGRANELQGISNEYRKIYNMSRFSNYYKKRPVGDDGLDLPFRPSRTEQNIDHMAKTLTETGKSARKYAVDDEGDLPVSNLETYARDLYARKPFTSPASLIPSNSSMVRNAVIRARARNAIYNNY